MSEFPLDRRKELARLMRATLADRRYWTYRAIRPLPVPPTWEPGRGVIADCSKGVQYLCRWAGCADPMGGNYDEWGNSQTLWSRLQHLGYPAALLVGDIVTFGTSGEKHAAMVLETGTDPLLWSFGHQGAPNTYRLSQDGRPAQYLRNPIPVYVPTPEDKLRAKTGWFAWVSWRLGEGDWKPYGRLDRNVRPNVPRLIPGPGTMTWWPRLTVFLANRKKGNKETTG